MGRWITLILIIVFFDNAFADSCNKAESREPNYKFFDVKPNSKVYIQTVKETIISKIKGVLTGKEKPDIVVETSFFSRGKITKGIVLAPEDSHSDYVVMYICESLSTIDFPPTRSDGKLYLIARRDLVSRDAKKSGGDSTSGGGSK